MEEPGYLLRRPKAFVHISPAMHLRRPEPLCEMRQNRRLWHCCDFGASCLFGTLTVRLLMVVADRPDGRAVFRMLTQLSRVMRVKAARVLVALYAFCLVAPVSFAFAGSALAHCLTSPAQVQHTGHPHGEAAHVHQGMTHAHADHDHQASAAAEIASAEAADAINDHAGTTHSGGKSAAPACCGVMCVSALPASLFELTPRAMTHASVVVASDAGIPGEAPDLLYRPPIILLSI